jgi:ABC-type Fe3+/spermidine/putrescine transport system ATPase subunit
MNFFDGQVQESANGIAIVDAGPLGTVEAATEDKVPGVGADILVAIRPEKLKLHFEVPGEGANIIEGRMGPAAYLGDRSHFHIVLPGRDVPVAVAVQNMEASVEGLVSTDQPVWLSFSSESVVLLGLD